MKGRPAIPGFARVAALLAVALLTLAGVRATVMQAGEALAATPMCAVATPGGAHGEHAPGKAHTACEFCAAAAHAPVGGNAPVFYAPIAVAWFAPAPGPALGPRGPPAFRARARAPPQLPTA